MMTVRAGNLSQHQGLLQGQRRNARERPQVQEEKVNALGARPCLSPGLKGMGSELC